MPSSSACGERDVADRPVDDGLHGAAVEERLDERERGPADGQAPEHERAVESRRSTRARARGPARYGRAARVCSRRRAAGSRPARSWNRSLSISSERRSRTCSTVRPRQRRNADRPRRVAPSVVRAGPASLALVPRSSARPASRNCAEGAVDERPRARVDAADLPGRAQRLCDRPAVCGSLAEETERGPLRQRGLCAGRTRHRGGQ